jgi:hypothetical protein
MSYFPSTAKNGVEDFSTKSEKPSEREEKKEAQESQEEQEEPQQLVYVICTHDCELGVYSPKSFQDEMSNHLEDNFVYRTSHWSFQAWSMPERAVKLGLEDYGYETVPDLFVWDDAQDSISDSRLCYVKNKENDSWERVFNEDDDEI